MNIDSIGKNIREARLALNLRQEDLAERTDLSAKYIGMIERGEKVPALQTLVINYAVLCLLIRLILFQMKKKAEYMMLLIYS